MDLDKGDIQPISGELSCPDFYASVEHVRNEFLRINAETGKLLLEVDMKSSVEEEKNKTGNHYLDDKSNKSAAGAKTTKWLGAEDCFWNV